MAQSVLHFVMFGLEQDAERGESSHRMSHTVDEMNHVRIHLIQPMR
jgi:hypothetical protein